MKSPLSLAEIQAAAAALKGRIVETPVLPLTSDRITYALPSGSSVVMKMEMFQQAGSFKARGVTLAIDALNEAERKAGITAVSAGNHALAVAWGANVAGLSAKVVMPKTADPMRVEGCRALGAEVVLTPDVETAFQEVDKLVEQEGRTMLHPFESPFMRLGAATCGLEFANAYSDMEIAIIPVGGGGLIAGMSSAIKLANPNCTIYGVEPFGADSMFQSYQQDAPFTLKKVATIADSLGSPMALADGYSITKQHVSEIVRVSDDELKSAMSLLFAGAKIAAEPACAASTAALVGPLAQRCEGKNVGIIACGSNISLEKFHHLIGSIPK